MAHLNERLGAWQIDHGRDVPMRASCLILLVQVGLGSSGCLVDNPLLCTSNSTCVDPERSLAITDVRCLPFERVAHCAFRDDSCPSALRWHESAAAAVAGQCVLVPDGGVDLAPMDAATPDLASPPPDVIVGDRQVMPLSDLTVPNDQSAPLDFLSAPDFIGATDLAVCGIPGAPCCANKICNLGVGCNGSTGRCKSASCDALPATCGANGNEGCCATALVPGGTFNRSNDPMYPAMVSGFELDKYEITVGRFRKFVEAGYGTQANPPADRSGGGVMPGTGWDAVWSPQLAADTNALRSRVQCGMPLQTWTGGNENRPMNCISWYEAFAFCIWDGGRLATEAEWNYAAAGGGEQREYPWSNPANSKKIDASYASYDCTGDGSAAGDCKVTDLLAVGMRPLGNGRWGHADLAGNTSEWTFDWYAMSYLGGQCNNCANTANAASRVGRGGAFGYGAPGLLSSFRNDGGSPTSRDVNFGARCARSP